MFDLQPVIPSFTQLSAIAPEIILTLGMCVALLLPLFARDLCRRNNKAITAVGMVTVLAALFAALTDLGSPSLAGSGHAFFHGTLVIDPFSQSVKALILLFTFLVFLQFIFTGSRREIAATDAPDYITLFLGATLGMCLMVSASNLLMMFVALEAASFPSFGLAAFRKNSKLGPEAGLKYVLFGSVASAIMLYGLSMFYGQYGTLDLHELAAAIAQSGPTWGLALGIFGLMIGVGFKLSAFPVHFWCPDVFEGASMEITTFLSVASKGAAVALLLRIMFTLGAAPGMESQPGLLNGITLFVGLTGGATATWGNLAALRQDNIKRMLAYSSIGHAGYMIMGCALVGRATYHVGDDPALATALASAILFYLFIYLFMNLGAFTIAGLIERAGGTLFVSNWTGFWRRNALLSLLLLVCLGSLFGFPPLGGFWGKVFIALEMWRDGAWWLVAILLTNTVISSYYYLLRPAYYMFMVQDKGQPRVVAGSRGVILAGISALVLLLAAVPTPISRWADGRAVMLLSLPAQQAAGNNVDVTGDKTDTLAAGGDPVHSGSVSEP
ncbi:MAG TPA: NADH-quinone oxidoreductase subunit N [Phycisphaeraceae bacterium]|nr:NADH-quinone oxidoreductase subunit N [Phycisphaeraceae bacterium]